jgi:Ser/Thr protein kinase RdoA (MazF antagonist)
MSEVEQLLPGGNVAGQVVRVGMTVRKPATIATHSVEAFLRHLDEVGFTGAPRTLGRDSQGRHMLEYIPGSPVDMSQPLSVSELHRIGQLIRAFHTAAESFAPPASARWNVAIRPDSEELICHHDLAPWNLVRDGDRWVFIDWDGSGPGSRLWDLAYAAQSFVPLLSKGDPEVDIVRLRIFVEGYGLDRAQCERLPQLIAQRTEAMHQLLRNGAQTGQQPWARLYQKGHGTYWRESADYIRRHQGVWKRRLLERG